MLQEKTNAQIVRHIPVQMAAVCSTQGEMQPLWFRYADDEGMIRTVHIQEVHSSREIRPAGIRIVQYICSAVSKEIPAGKEYVFELRFYVMEHKWIFYKMLGG